MLYGNVNGYEGRPTLSQIDRTGVLDAQLKAAIGKLDALFDGEGASINAELARQKLPVVTRASWEEWDRSRTS